jgi:hypothetical protein
MYDKAGSEDEAKMTRVSQECWRFCKDPKGAPSCPPESISLEERELFNIHAMNHVQSSVLVRVLVT